jgi:hypothetical protein
MKHHAFSPRAAVPGVPTGLTAIPGNGTATLSWFAPASDGGSAIQNYRIEGGTSPSSDDIGNDASGHTVTLGGLTNGTTYYFRVDAENPNGDGPLRPSRSPRMPWLSAAPWVGAWRTDRAENRRRRRLDRAGMVPACVYRRFPGSLATTSTWDITHHSWVLGNSARQLRASGSMTQATAVSTTSR